MGSCKPRDCYGRLGWMIGALVLAFSFIHAVPLLASQAVQTVRLPLVEGKDIRFTRLSTEEGLSQSRVDHILQDTQGFMWIGTYNGLNRFDGYRPKVYKQEVGNHNTLGGVFVTALFQDRSGMLWIGVDQGLDRFDPVSETFTHFVPNGSNPEGLSGHLEHMTEDRDGNLWLATRNGLDRFDPSSGHFKHYRYDPANPHSLGSNDTRYVYEDREGTLWVATGTDLNAFDRRTKTAVRYPNFQEAPLDRILEDRAGVLWVCSTRGGGLASLDRKTGQFTRYTFFDEGHGEAGMRGCSAIDEDQYGMLWLATKPDGLVKFDRLQRKFTRYRNDPDNPASISNNDALSLEEDHEGGIWVGTDGGGVNRFSSKPSPFTSYRRESRNPNGLGEGPILAVFEDSQGALWFGTSELNRLDRASGKYTFYRHDSRNDGSISNGTVHAIAEDASGTLWFGTWGGGLNRFDRRTGRFTAYRHRPSDPTSLSNDFILSLFIDHAGGLWVGTEDGVNRLDPTTGRFTVYRNPNTSPESRISRVLTEGSEGSMWLGTYESGLEHLDVGTGKIVTYMHDPSVRSSLSSNRVNALCRDRSGTLWVGTQNGLNRFDPASGGFTTFYEHDGLANNAVQGILEDDADNLWLATGNGLSKFDPRTRIFKNYYSEDGLAGDEFNNSSVYFKSAHGEMFFGGVKGVTAFFPDHVTDKPFVPPVVLTEFRLFGEPVKIGGDSPLQKSISFTDSLSLSHRQNKFSLEFASLSYANPLRNRYRYTLEGPGEKWIDVDSNHRLVTFPILPAGKYVLRVQGSSNRSVWNEQGIALRIRVLPPWWGTWWFRLTAVIVLVASAWSAYRLRLRAVEDRNRELVAHNREMQQSQHALQTSEEEQRRLNRELRAISNCNEALIRAGDERTLLNEICRIICDDAGYRMAWVGYVEHDETKTIRPVAWGGVEEGYLAAAALTWAETERGSGPSAIAIRRGETSYTQDLATSPAFAPWRAEALKRGYRSVITFPLKDDHRHVFGVLAIYSTEVSSFTPEEIRLLEELAGDMAFGILVLRARIEHDRTEQALRQSQQKYRTFFEQNLAGNYISTPAGTLLACNPAFLSMFGFESESEAKQTNTISLYRYPEKRDPFLQLLKQQRQVKDFGKEFLRKDGSLLYVIENAVGAFNEQGELVEIHGFMIDETERKKVEQQLRQAQKMEIIGKLSGGIAHDFNNILGVVNGYSEILLRRRPLDASSRHDIQEILHAGQQAALLTRQLLAFSRKQVLRPRVINLNDVVEDVEKMLRRLLGEEVETITTLQRDLELIEADPGQMEQIILNLCINARDAMPEGGSITIETSNVDVDSTQATERFAITPGHYVRLTVTDTGTGMDKETLAQIFEPFFTTKGPDKGTGLGLATVNSIVKQSGGSVWVSSELGRGAAFSVYLPATAEEQTIDAPEHREPELARGVETILLVEDAASLRAMLRTCLEASGYTVLAAEDADHAIQISQSDRRKIDLLLTDLSLPKVKGPAMAKTITEHRPGMKVLYMSGYASNTVAGILNSGAGFLQKPFSEEELMLKVREMLDTAQEAIPHSSA